MPSLLSINNYYYRRGGAEFVFFEQNRLFQEVGWKVVPFSMQHPKNILTAWSSHFISEIEHGHPYSLVQKTLRASKAIYSFEARNKLRSLVNLVQPDVCHCHNIYHHISPSILGLLKEHGIPTLMTLHDLKLLCPAYNMLCSEGVCERCLNGKVYNVLRHRCMKGSIALSAIVMLESLLHQLLGTYMRYVDRFIVPSRFYLQKMTEWGWDSRRISYVPNFVDVSSLRPEFAAGKAFLYFGRLSPEKGLQTLLRAAALAGAPLWIAGAGPLEGSLRRLGEQIGADVTFWGFQHGKALYDMVRSARATVLPSEWYENAPISVLESYALGKPVIGASIGGIPELIREGETGISFESNSVEDLAEALRIFMKMPDKRLTAMGQCGRGWVESEFSPVQYRKHLLETYGVIGVSLSESLSDKILQN